MAIVLTPTKDVAVTAPISTQSLASNTVFKSSEIDVSTKFGVGVWIYLGRTVTTALTAALKYRIEGSFKSSGDNAWASLYEWSSNTAACQEEAVSGTCNAGQNVINVASTTGFTVGDRIFIKNSTFANSEWGRIKSIVTNTSVTLEDNLVNAQTGSTIYDDAQWEFVPVDVQTLARLRVVADGSNTGQAVAIRVEAAYFNSVTGT